MPYTGPVPTIDGNPYPDPFAPGNVTGPAAVTFDGWTTLLSPLEGSAQALGPELAGIEGSRDSMEAPLSGAVGAYTSTGLFQSMTGLQTEFGQPNPIGTKLPFTFTSTNLPSQTPPTANLLFSLRDRINQYLAYLWQGVSQYWNLPPPPHLG